MLFTETWLTDNDSPPYFRNYQCVNRNRSDKRGGGVAIYLRRHLSCSVLDEYSVVDCTRESLVIQLEKALVAVVYRPPTGDKDLFLSFLEDMLRYMCSTSLPFLIMGDININTMASDTHSTDFFNLIASYGCYNQISLPTRITGDCARSLDVCLTKLGPNDIISGAFSSDISDHLPIFCLTSLSHHRKKDGESLHCRNINEESLNQFHVLVENIDWSDTVRNKNPDTAFSDFSTKLKSCFNEAFAMFTAKRKNKKYRKSWINSRLYKQIKMKNKMYHFFVQTRNPESLAEFKKSRNKLTSDITKAKCLYYQGIFADITDDPRRMGQTANDITGRKQYASVVQEIEIAATCVTGYELTDAMNSYFVNVGEYHDADNTAEYESDANNQLVNSLMLDPTTPFEVEKYVNKLRNNVAAGVDELKPIPIKYVSSIISHPLADIINKTLQTGVFPNELKMEKVSPFIKEEAIETSVIIGRYRFYLFVLRYLEI